MPTKFASTFVWAILSTSGLIAQESPNGPDALVLRVRPDIALNDLRFIANLAEPKPVAVDPKLPLQELLRRHYGSSHEKLRAIFLEYNPDYESRSAEGKPFEVLLPALPVWKFNVTLSPSPANTVLQQVAKHTGEAGSMTQQAVAKLNPNLGSHLLSAATTAIQVPYVTGYFTVELKEEMKPKQESILSRLEKLEQAGPVQQIDRATNMELVPHWQPSTATMPAVGSLSVDPSASMWAFGMLAKSQLDPRTNTVVIAVVDSGISRLKGQADDRFRYWTRTRTPTPRTLRVGTLYCSPDIVGCNVLNPLGFPEDDVQETKWASHGTHVSGLATGRLLSIVKGDLDERIQLMVLKVVNQNGKVDSGHVTSAIQYADQHGVDIINLSLSGPRNSSVEKAIIDSASRLVVIAAGNADQGPGVDLDSLGSEDQSTGFPARLGRQMPNAIVVAAHDKEGRLAPFSNYGGTTVDIAAPGVELASTVVGGALASRSGTSQAAPLVSFTAALLRASGFRSKPAELKHRLLASVDVTAELKTQVFSKGKLNIVKALSFRDDVVHLADGTLLRGRIEKPSGLSMAGRRRTQWDELRKVVLNYSGELGKRHLLMINAGEGESEYWEGEINLETFNQLSLKEVGKTVATTVSVTDIIDITVRSQ